MEKNILHIPSLAYFNNDWNELQRFLKNRGNPPYHFDGDLNLRDTSIESLGNLKSVGGNLYLRNTSIKDLGNLTSVGGDLDLRSTPIESLGNLSYVGNYLFLENTPISTTMTKDDIRSQIGVDVYIYV